MCNKEEEKREQCDCDSSCEECASKCADTKTMPNGERVATFKEQPSIVDVAKMLAADEGFKKATAGADIVATRILKHTNGQDSVVQIYFHKKSSIQVVSALPRA